MSNDGTRAEQVDVPLRFGIALGAGSAAAMAQIGAGRLDNDARAWRSSPKSQQESNSAPVVCYYRTPFG
jgi:hypothetical protein